MFGLFKKLGIPPRHRSAAYMNLAFGKTPTAVGTWDQTPAPLGILTDEGDVNTGLTTLGSDNDNGTTVGVEIDLGAEYEIYEIIIKNPTTGAFKKVAGVIQDVELKTKDAVGSGTTRDTQAVAGDNVSYDSTLHYLGNGIPVKKVQIITTMSSAHTFALDLSEIEVYGC